MRRRQPAVLLVLAAFAAAQPGGHYYRMKPVHVVDEQGFGQPVEVARLLVPADWRVEGGVQWDGQELGCPFNIIKVRFRAVSPDGMSGLEVFPGMMWQAASDPTMQQIIRQQAAQGMGCGIGPVTGAADYLRQMAPSLRPGARALGSEPLPAVTQAKQQQLSAIYGPLMRAGAIRGFRADAASVRIAYSLKGQAMEEWVSSSLLSVGAASANTAALMQGQMNMSAATFTMALDPVFAIKAPAGKFDTKLAATILASIRPNPQYEAAVSRFLANMGNIAIRGAMDRSRIWTEAGRQISATISQSYQAQQAVQDRLAGQFSQTIRGVETYVDPSGKRIELTGGYDNAWVNPRGEYLLSDTPGFNPAAALREDWTPLRKAR
jgi:hypothetical protein